jgi:hypothetical protein
VRLALDHHYSPLIAVGLRDRGHDVRAVSELGWQSEEDEPLLARCSGEGLALVTNNVVDFAVIAQRWADEGRVHAGLVFTSDARWPRRRDMIGRFVDALDVLLAGNAGTMSLAGRIHWL